MQIRMAIPQCVFNYGDEDAVNKDYLWPTYRMKLQLLPFKYSFGNQLHLSFLSNVVHNVKPQYMNT